MNVKLYVVCHEESYVPEHPFLYPIQVGTELAGKPLSGMLHDNEGDNISAKNKSYCELTAHYWVWKNEEADYYGLFHYRRYMAFNPGLKRDDGWGNVAYDKINPEVMEELGFDLGNIEKMVSQYDIIAVCARKYPRVKEDGEVLDVYHEYGRVPFQHREDLDVTLKVLLEKYPEYQSVVTEYMHGTEAHECNMFIMTKKEYHKYCEWLFDILFEVEKRIDMIYYSVEEYRVIGYLAERLFGIYFSNAKKQPEIKTFELPKTLFVDTAPKQVLEPVFAEGVPVVLSANDRFSPYLDIMIQSMIMNASKDRNYDFIILYNDITEKNQELIKLAANGKHNISIRFVRVCDYFDSEKLFVDQHLSVETYYRLIIPEIMPNYHKILYLDCDMVADHDVAELYDIDLGNCIIGAAKDIDVAGQVNLRNGWEKYAVETLKLDKPYDYFQAGVLIVDLDALRNATTSVDMIKLALSKPWRCHDQDVLNVVCKNRVYYIPQRWNVLMSWQEPGRSRMQIMKMAPRDLYEEYMKARKQPYMIHFAGYQKPWDVVDCDFAWYFWKYAAMSPYYVPVLMKNRNCTGNSSGKQMQNAGSAYDNAGVRKIANIFLPVGTRRREVVKFFLKLLVR